MSSSSAAPSPKSASLASSAPSPRRVSRRFDGLTSRCVIPAACTTSSASATCATTSRRSESGGPPSSHDFTEGPSTYSISRKNGGRSPSVTSWTCTRLGCAWSRKRFNSRASRLSAGNRSRRKQNLKTSVEWSARLTAFQTSPNPPSPSFASSTQLVPGTTTPAAGRHPSSSSPAETGHPFAPAIGAWSGAVPSSPTSQTWWASATPLNWYESWLRHATDARPVRSSFVRMARASSKTAREHRI